MAKLVLSSFHDHVPCLSDVITLFWILDPNNQSIKVKPSILPWHPNLEPYLPFHLIFMARLVSYKFLDHVSWLSALITIIWKCDLVGGLP
jgi:hypothetical protein